MYLKMVNLENFKSFGKKLTIPFLEGFTSITGPNGSGKSNIADAILFVLGPKSSKVIRAGKLTDLIFNGGKEGKPSRYCKVTLVFDNKDRIIPIEEDEVRLMRIVKYSPSNIENYYSYFYVNERSSSLSEFSDLLANARISADSYNIVQQGDINAIVRMGNTQRRKIMDDISGITKFEKKRNEVENNLERINIYLEEISRQLDQLKKDRNDALKYNNLREKLNISKAKLAYKKKENIEKEIKSINNQIESYKKEKIILQERLEDLREEEIKSKRLLEELENEIVEKGGDEAKKLKEQIDELRIEIAKIKEGISYSKEEIAHLKNEKLKAKRDIELVEKELKKQNNEKDVILNKLEEKENVKKGKAKELKDTQNLIAHTDSKTMGIQRKLSQIKREFERREREAHEYKLEKERLIEKIERINNGISQIEESISNYEFEVKDIEWVLKDFKKDDKGTVKWRKEAESQLFKKRKLEDNIIKELRTLEPQIRRLTYQNSQAKAESQAAEDFRGNRSVNAILNARNNRDLKGIHGTISELAKVNKEYEIALSIAAGNRMQAIVVEDDEAGAKAISFLKRKNVGRATFLPLNKIISGRPRGKALMAVKDSNSIGFAINLVDFDEKYKNAFWYVFGDTVVVNNLNTARKLMGGVRLATLDGELIEASGAMIGGNIKKLLKFKSESDVEKISKELISLIEHQEKLSSQLIVVREEIERIETEFRARGNKLDSKYSKVKDLELKRKEYKSILDNNKKDSWEKKKELAETERSFADINKKLKECENFILELEKEREEQNEILMKATSQELVKQLRDLQNELNILNEKILSLISRKDTLATQIELQKDRQNELKEKFEVSRLKIEEEKYKIKILNENAAENKNSLNALIKIEDELSKELGDLREKRDKAFRKVTNLENEIDKYDGKLDTYSSLISDFGFKLPVLEESLVEVNIEIHSYNVKFDGTLPTIDELKRTIKYCERAMESLEPVNMRAIDDYDISQKRKQNLNNELKNLNDQRGELITLVDEIKKKKKYGLNKVFVSVNENFKEIYSQLSIGGSAELVMENPENPFEGGLIIKARPKGKKVLRLEALSGGEKSMTALAFIFAIQRFMPSPFYVLDEVDMFLDGINTESVAKMIKNNSKGVQFIQVSLRKTTLKEADHVYGVTMQSSGISEVIGNVNLEDIGEEGEIHIKKVGGVEV